MDNLRPEFYHGLHFSLKTIHKCWVDIEQESSNDRYLVARMKSRVMTKTQISHYYVTSDLPSLRTNF